MNYHAWLEVTSRKMRLLQKRVMVNGPMVIMIGFICTMQSSPVFVFGSVRGASLVDRLLSPRKSENDPNVTFNFVMYSVVVKDTKVTTMMTMMMMMMLLLLLVLVLVVVVVVVLVAVQMTKEMT
jgi:hypothetical protein